ncbi:MAG: SusD/RagB family nutrient-binding outer membrane lipoprotein, partial [Lutibacter sp.]
MKRFKIITLLLFGLLVSVGCDSDFEEINTDPNNPTAVPSSLLIPGVVRAAQNNSYSTFIGGDMGACWSQQFAKVQYNDEERYIPRQSVITSVWNTWYAVVIADSDAMHTIAIA